MLDYHLLFTSALIMTHLPAQADKPAVAEISLCVRLCAQMGHLDDDTVMVSSQDADDGVNGAPISFADFDTFSLSPPTAHQVSKVWASDLGLNSKP